MEFSKNFQISTDYKDLSSSVNWEMLQFAEVVFVDKTHSANRPLLYQLSDNKLTLDQILYSYKSNSLAFSRDAFIFVGEIIFIDKKKKQISLSNKNVVAYNHLVIASGKKPVLALKDKEMVAALQALADALRMKPKIPDSFPTSPKDSSKMFPQKKETVFAANDRSATAQDQQTIGKIVQPCMTAAEPKFSSCSLDTSNSRFYEVQI